MWRLAQNGRYIGAGMILALVYTVFTRSSSSNDSDIFIKTVTSGRTVIPQVNSSIPITQGNSVIKPQHKQNSDKGTVLQNVDTHVIWHDADIQLSRLRTAKKRTDLKNKKWFYNDAHVSDNLNAMEQNYRRHENIENLLDTKYIRRVSDEIMDTHNGVSISAEYGIINLVYIERIIHT